MLKFYNVMYDKRVLLAVRLQLFWILFCAMPIFSFLERWTIFLLMKKNVHFRFGRLSKRVSFIFFFLREDASNTLRVLVATDCHLGYMEKDEVRRHDSFQAFEEICSIADQKQVIIKILYFVFLIYSIFYMHCRLPITGIDILACMLLMQRWDFAAPFCIFYAHWSQFLQ